ncbi:MAG: PIG-L family deacetylase [Kiloniellales bacterium]|nr:PIG-L family deacetylase [Kiloniellales bacterium]
MPRERILILIPHPDDEVVGCSAAIGRARASGASLFGLYLTSGVPLRELLWPWDRAGREFMVERRWAEAQAAAVSLGLLFVGRQPFATRTLKDHMVETYWRIDEALKDARATELWAPAYEGGHQDHDVANFLASRFADRIRVREFPEYNFVGGRVCSQAFHDADGEEEVIKLVPEEAERKRARLALYRSEQGNLGHIRVEQECFRPLRRRDYARPPHPGRLFYQRFQWVPHHPRIDYCRPEEVCQAIARFSADHRGRREASSRSTSRNEPPRADSPGRA